MKMSFSKQEPKIFYYRDYKTFDDEHFKNDLKYVFNKRCLNNISCSEFEDINDYHPEYTCSNEKEVS